MQKTPEIFDLRNEKAKEIEFCTSHKNKPDMGEFWRYYDGINIGNEISKDGRFLRACLILDNALGNGLILALPMTTKFHHHMSSYYVFLDHLKYNTKPSNGILRNHCKTYQDSIE